MKNKQIKPAMMTADEARTCADAIKKHFDDCRWLILDLHEREGWKALGYSSWRHCVTSEFDQSKSHCYRQLDAALIEREISPMGEIGSIPERQLRPLTRLEPAQQVVAYTRAVETAPNGKVTAKHIAAVVEEMAPKRPLSNQATFLDEPEEEDEPDEPPSPAQCHHEAWLKIFEELNILACSIPRRGGIAVMARGWSRDQIESCVAALENSIESLNSYVSSFKEMINGQTKPS